MSLSVCDLDIRASGAFIYTTPAFDKRSKLMGVRLTARRKSWLFVIACNSSFVYKGKAVDVRHVGRELGVRYVLEGLFARTSQQLSQHQRPRELTARRPRLNLKEAAILLSLCGEH